MALALAVSTAACGGPRAPQQQLHTSRANEYRSLKQLARDADAVVEFAVDVAGGVEKVGAMPFTVTEARVVDVLKGTFEDDAIRLRQVGATQSQGLVAEGELLEPGKHYVALVVPFTFSDYRPTGQHVAVGGWQGLYRVEGDELVATDKARSELPRRLLKSSFVAAVSEP